MTKLKYAFLLMVTNALLSFSFLKTHITIEPQAALDRDSLKYTKQIRTSLILLRLIKTNNRDSILNFYLNDCWKKKYSEDLKLYHSILDDAVSLIKEFGIPTGKEITIIKGHSREKCETHFPDTYGVSIRYQLSKTNFRKNYGLIEFYFTEEQYDKVSIIFSSNPKDGRR